MLQPLDAPAQRVTERVDQRIAEAGDRRDLRALAAGRAPVAHESELDHDRSRPNASDSRLGDCDYMPSYCGPPPPSGGTQVITWYGSMMSHVLQCTQFDALICRRGVPSAVVRRSRRRWPDRTARTDGRTPAADRAADVGVHEQVRRLILVVRACPR